MSLTDAALRDMLVEPGSKLKLADRDPAWKGGKELEGLDRDELKQFSKDRLESFVAELEGAQELLYADNRYAILVVFQAMDAAGKDGTIKHVMSGVNPQGVEVSSFKQPSSEELDHHFLWRYGKRVPERGRIGIFNRSYYEEVLVQRVHPEWLENQRLPPKTIGKRLWKERYDDINAFERHLVRNGIVVVKFFLHVSKDEQKRRFLARLDEPEKNWKFSVADLRERGFWDLYQDAYQDALTATSTTWAPWYVVPADHKFVMRTLVAGVLAATIRRLDLSFPEVSPEAKEALATAREQLLAE